MTPADDVIARAARAVRPALIARAAETGGTVTPPGEAEIALAIRDMVTRVQTDQRVEDNGLAVEWRRDGQVDEIHVSLAVAAIKPEELR